MMKRWGLYAVIPFAIAMMVVVGGRFIRVSSTETPSAAKLVARCASCHQKQAEEFLKTPHANTLHSATDTEARSRFAGEVVRVGELSTEFRYTDRNGRLLLSGQRLNTELPVDWFFGSGRHAQTPVSVKLNNHGETESLEHHVTWYASHGLDLTIDHPQSAGIRNGDAGNGHRPDAAIRCFGCHTTELPLHGKRIDFEGVLPGLLCSKCHPGADKHASSMEFGNTTSRINKWSELTPKQSVAKCAECHRMPFQVSADELSPMNPGLTRFASVGLLMTRCFHDQETRRDKNGQPMRFDCMTCHDPHSPSTPTPEIVNQICRSCHQQPTKDKSDCPQQTLQSNCTLCHMPKVKLDSPIHFTDHWIRVRRQDEP